MKYLNGLPNSSILVIVREWRDTTVLEDGETIGTEAEFLIPKTDAERVNLKEEIVVC